LENLSLLDKADYLSCLLILKAGKYFWRWVELI